MSLQALSVTQTSRLTRSGRSNCRQAADLIVAAQAPAWGRTGALCKCDGDSIFRHPYLAQVQVRELRIAHDGASGTTGQPQFDELLATLPGSKMSARIAAARNLGVEVTA